MAKKARKLAESDSYFTEFTGLEYRGNMNTTVIRTAQGRTIILQHDATDLEGKSPMGRARGIC